MSGTTIDHMLRQQVEQRPDSLSLICGDRRLSYRELDLRSDQVAAGFQSLGIGKGDSVAVLSPNRMEVLELFFGLARAGVVQVPLNAFLKGEFLRHQLADSQATAIVVDSAGLTAVLGLLDVLPDLRTVVCLDELPNQPVPVSVVSYPDLVSGGGSPDDAGLAPADLMSIVYTSGTTGLPKGCMLSHGYYLRVGRVMLAALEIGGDDVLLTALPLFHGAARMMVLTAGLVRGIPVVIEPEFRASTFIDRAVEVGATVAMGVGAMGLALLGQPPRPTDRAHKLRTFLLIPFPAAKQLEFRERFGIEAVGELFGQTECVPITWSPVSGVRNRASCGRAGSDLIVEILDDEDRPVPDGEVGEICLRPKNPLSMFSGYWRNPEATLQSFSTLWHHTGDYGRRDADGFIYFVDRKKDAVRRRGENVSTFEVEAAIVKNPKIAEVAVHAVPAETEDDIKACIVPAEGVELAPEELFEFFSSSLPYYAVPRYVEIVPSLPKNAVGRVMKFELRERALSGPGVWDFERLGLTCRREARR